MLLTIEELNALSLEDFTAKFGNIIEHSAVLIVGAWYRKPFRSFDHFLECVYGIVDTLPRDVQRAVLGIHPDLAGRLAQAGALTNESTKEQNSAGLTSLSSAEKDKITSLNDRYRRRFGFPFVICARLSAKQRIMEQLEARLENAEDAELRVGIQEVKKICLLRAMDLLQHDSNSDLVVSLNSKL